METERIYYSPLLSSTNKELTRRDSFLSITSISGSNNKSSLSINEMIDQLPDGDIPESFVGSESDQKIFQLGRLSPGPISQHPTSTKFPPIATARPQRSLVTANTLVDLFQIVQ